MSPVTMMDMFAGAGGASTGAVAAGAAGTDTAVSTGTCARTAWPTRNP